MNDYPTFNKLQVLSVRKCFNDNIVQYGMSLTMEKCYRVWQRNNEDNPYVKNVKKDFKEFNIFYMVAYAALRPNGFYLPLSDRELIDMVAKPFLLNRNCLDGQNDTNINWVNRSIKKSKIKFFLNENLEDLTLEPKVKIPKPEKITWNFIVSALKDSEKHEGFINKHSRRIINFLKKELINIGAENVKIKNTKRYFTGTFDIDGKKAEFFTKDFRENSTEYCFRYVNGINCWGDLENEFNKINIFLNK